MSVIGWLGLGNMGSRMTANLVKAGHTVNGFDLNPDACEAAAKNGVNIVGGTAEVVEGADVVFTMLPKGAHVRSVFEGDNGIWAHADKSTLLVDSSTIDIETSKFLHEESAKRGFRFVDAPVSGGISGAEAATLAFMIGGDADAADEARGYIEPMAGNIFNAGGPTMGIAAKIANNMMLSISMLANSEGSQLARRLGLDPKVFWDIASTSSGQSWAQQKWYPVPGITGTSPADNNFDAGFSADLARKDVALALEAGESAGINLPAATLACSQLSSLIDEGLGSKDCTLIAKYVDPASELQGLKS
ncbi:3-hydroxyisobutyrate dehydrogenase [Corynebacterium lubricantis]|uniref:3-hydroxyisobutyrate dehydrogenase n=1 Tax=Corynebacterium lubricantis TaxID=541095 RepID=UPI00035D9839|nr:3-hydroxyisobutyrate dehydrogenase [Corynebacterium lubricantis]